MNAIMEIKVRIESQFGIRRVFPVCAQAKLFCRIADKTTLTDDAIEAVKLLGYRVSVVPDVTKL